MPIERFHRIKFEHDIARIKERNSACLHAVSIYEKTRNHRLATDAVEQTNENDGTSNWNAQWPLSRR